MESGPQAAKCSKACFAMFPSHRCCLRGLHLRSSGGSCSVSVVEDQSLYIKARVYTSVLSKCSKIIAYITLCLYLNMFYSKEMDQAG